MRAGNHTLMRSFLWLSSATMFAKIIDLAAIIVVLSLVSPTEIGEASVAWTVITLAEPFAALGVNWGLLTLKRVDRLTLHSANVLSLSGGALSCAFLLATAPLIARLFGTPDVAPLLMVGSLKLLPVALLAVPQQRLARVLRHREIAAASAIATLSSALVRVVLALLHFGAWSFVLSQVSYSLFLWLGLSMLAPLWPRLRFDRERAHDLLKLGLPSTLSSAIVQWARNVDYLLVAAFLGVVPLGLYRVAFDLAMEPVVAAGDAMARSATPTLRKLSRSHEQLLGAFAYAVRTTLSISLPLSVLTFVFAPKLLELLRDPSFVSAAAATRWLVIAAVLRVLLGLYTPLAVALGRPNLALRASTELLVLLVVSLTVCLWMLGGTLSIASAGVAWCTALVLSLALNHARFREALAELAVIRAARTADA